MTIPFNQIPAGNQIKTPLFYAEFDNSQAGYFSQNKKAVLIGQKLTVGTADVNTVVPVGGADVAKTLFGRGSMLAKMVDKYRKSDPFGEIWCLPLADAGAGVAATGTVTIAGTATANGTIALYVAGQLVSVAVTSGNTNTDIATAMAAAINANLDLPVTASAASGVVTVTCRWKGATGNDIRLLDSFYGQAGGESVPAGITLTYSGNNLLSGGATNPTLTGAPISALGDDEYDYVISPYSDTVSLDAIKTEMVSRWSYLRQIYGHAYTAQRGTLATLTTLGQSRDDKHCTIYGYENDVINPVWAVAVAYAARNATFLNADVSRPTQTGVLDGICAPRKGLGFLKSERNALLGYGIATAFADQSGQLLIERAITTYQKNAWGQSDPSYMDSETMHQLTEITRRLRSVIVSKFSRHKLANDGTRYSPGDAIVTPSVIRAELIAQYMGMERLGLVENAALFSKYLIVERNADNPNRIDVLLPPDLVNQLRIFAVLNQFRLQYPAA